MTGTELRQYRRAVLDLTQEELATLLDISPRSLSSHENRTDEIPKLIEFAVRGVHWMQN